MHFVKMQGLGNDFIIIEDDGSSDYSSLSRKLCDRHFGIGADGILVVRKSESCDRRMLIINSDGSHAEMCGNGVRCFAKYLYDNKYVDRRDILIETDAGVVKVRLEVENNTAKSVEVNMGRPDLNPVFIIDGSETRNMTVNKSVDINGKTFNITYLIMGVPHAALFVDSIDAEEAGYLGPLIGLSDYFWHGSNVNFVTVINRNEYRVRTWERGAGLTLACGTGACASLAAGVLNNLLDRRATAHLPGGDLTIEWTEDGNIYMAGPAEYVFKGEY